MTKEQDFLLENIENIGILIPPASHSINLTLFPEGNLVLPNGTTTQDTILIKRADKDVHNGFEKQPRGILVSVENETFWEDCLDCFSSIPVSNLGLE